METLVILVVAAGLSAAVVWWAMSPTDAHRRSEPRRPPGAPMRASPARVEETADGFVLLPGDDTAVPDDRPSAAWSLLRLALAIAIVSAVIVAAVALIGLLVKLQLDQYFTTGA